VPRSTCIKHVPASGNLPESSKTCYCFLTTVQGALTALQTGCRKAHSTRNFAGVASKSMAARTICHQGHSRTPRKQTMSTQKCMHQSTQNVTCEKHSHRLLWVTLSHVRTIAHVRELHVICKKLLCMDGVRNLLHVHSVRNPPTNALQCVIKLASRSIVCES
jgi:hypothetical protein